MGCGVIEMSTASGDSQGSGDLFVRKAYGTVRELDGSLNVFDKREWIGVCEVVMWCL